MQILGSWITSLLCCYLGFYLSWVLDVVSVTPGPEELGEGAGRARVSRGISWRKVKRRQGFH